MVPVTLAAAGPAMLRLAGEVAVGVRLHGSCTRRYLDAVVVPELRAGMARSGRARDRVEVSCGGFIATGRDDEAVAAMVEWVRQRVAFYPSTPAYWPMLDLQALGDLGRKLNVMTKAGHWDRMAAEISDDDVRLLAAVGTRQDLAKVIDRRSGGLAGAVLVSGGYGVRQDIPRDLLQDIRGIPSVFAGHGGGSGLELSDSRFKT
jgi:alkanesulfonate monooxygenase SsuD/methylene tetrahydromethanopterin reductase-like flavin-dependent oxidoreductase (luciferase family)